MKKAEDKTIFFHVGLPKTASTFLQRNVFPNFRNIRFVKKHDFKRRDKIIEQTDHTKILLSIELNLDAEGGLSKVRDVAKKYPQTRPIIILRKHGSWLKSKYKYYLRKHGNREFKDYFKFDDQGVLLTANLLFYPKIELLEHIFETKPLVLFQEELKENPYATIDLLADYMGANYTKKDIRIKTVKKSYSPKQLKAVRRFNKIYKHDHSNIDSKTVKFIYKKFSGFLLHSVAFLSLLVPQRLITKKSLIPEDKIQKVNEAFREDWEKCLDYARRQRKLLFSPE
jgi:hypothetical protein